MRVVIFALMLLALVACGPAGITQTNRTARYSVTMTIDAARVGQRTITIGVSDAGGAPTAVEQVVVAPVMQEMGMASPEMAAAQVAPGRYEVRGEPFSMLGAWQLNVRIVAAGQEDTTSFSLTVE
jgi:hypothetical protein